MLSMYIVTLHVCFMCVCPTCSVSLNVMFIVCNHCVHCVCTWFPCAFHVWERVWTSWNSIHCFYRHKSGDFWIGQFSYVHVGRIRLGSQRKNTLFTSIAYRSANACNLWRKEQAIVNIILQHFILALNFLELKNITWRKLESFRLTFMLNGELSCDHKNDVNVLRKKLTAKVILDHCKSPRTGVLQKVCTFPWNCMIVSFIPSFTLLTVTPCKRTFSLWLNLEDFNQGNTDYKD